MEQITKDQYNLGVAAQQPGSTVCMANSSIPNAPAALMIRSNDEHTEYYELDTEESAALKSFFHLLIVKS